MDHGVSCSGGSNRASSLAGGIIERAATVAIRCFADTAERKPRLDLHMCFQRINPNDEAKSYGDVLSTKCGRIVAIDITFSSRTNLSLDQLEQMKTNDYRVNRVYDPDDS
jgi:hypothetical protein